MDKFETEIMLDDLLQAQRHLLNARNTANTDATNKDISKAFNNILESIADIRSTINSHRRSIPKTLSYNQTQLERDLGVTFATKEDFEDVLADIGKFMEGNN